MYLGIDTFYIGELEALQGIQLILDGGESGNNGEPEINELEQQSTMGIGVRVGLLDDSGVLGGNVYIDLGYVETEMQGMGSAIIGGVSVVIPRTSVDFKGSYWGAGYELAFTKNLALRMEFHNYDYDDEEVPALLSISSVAAPTNDPDASVDNKSIFFGLTGRF